MIDRNKKPHVHAAIIKAWADGAEIEYWSPGRHQWVKRSIPSWAENGKYRVKPEPHKYQALIDAFRAGATDIQILTKSSGWHYCKSIPDTSESRSRYPFNEQDELRRAHKWQKEMDAYAAGKTIQAGYPTTHPQHGWYDVINRVPCWDNHHPDCVYRIKPEKMVRRVEVFLTGSNHILNMVEQRDHGHLELTFEDEKLIDAQVLK